jgi:two-component system phosphate regulon sensor histidine kinase PhoR
MAAAEPPPLDPAALLARLTDLVDEAETSSDEGRQRAVEFACTATGAVGATLAAYTGSGGRIVAATPSVQMLLGRPVDTADPAVAKLLTGPAVQQVGLDQLPADSADVLRERGLHRLLLAVGSSGGVPVGSLQVYFTDAGGQAGEYQRNLVRFLATWAVRLCREAAGPDQSDQARDLFVAVTSHELRTPVTVIKGYADTLVERWESLTETARREAVYVVGQRSRELARLVDRLLHAASDAAGLMHGANPMPVDPAEALRVAAADLPADLRRALKVTVPDRLPTVRGDRAGLATVLTELVRNACKYSPGPVDVELTAGADARTVWIRVTDRGVGIRPEHAERAFERFWQLDTGDQRRYGGVGLGLYLVRRIVERQQGWVSLRPRPGGGTVAEVRLPRVDAGSGEA